MHRPVVSRSASHWIISILLVVLSVRALIPAGFMPDSERPFSLKICPDGFPAALLHEEPGASGSHHEASAHHHHGAIDHQAAPGQHHAPDHQQPAHSSHDQNAARAEHCVFAAAASAGPAPQIALSITGIERDVAPLPDFVTPRLEQQRHRVQQPRAPPALS